MNFETYASTIAKKFTRNHEESERILKFLFDKISTDLSRGRRVYFRGFGSFKRIRRPARRYRDIPSGRIKVRPPKKDIHFNPSQDLLKNL